MLKGHCFNPPPIRRREGPGKATACCRSYPLRDDKARTTVEDTHVDAQLVEPITHGRRKGAMVGGLLWRPLTLRPSPSHPGRPAAAVPAAVGLPAPQRTRVCPACLHALAPSWPPAMP